MHTLVLALCLALVPLLVARDIEEFTLLPKLLFLQIATWVLLLVLGWTKEPREVRWSALLAPVGLFYLLLALSAIWAVNPYRTTFDLNKHVTFLVFFLVVLQSPRKLDLETLLIGVSLGGGLVALIGIIEYHGLFVFIPSTGRPSATFGYRNLAAFYLAAGTPLAAALYATGRGLPQRITGILSASLMMIFLLYTRARGSWVGLFCAVLLGLGLWLAVARGGILAALTNVLDRRGKLVGAVGILLVVGLGFLPAGFKEGHVQRFDEKKADFSTTVSSIFKKGGDRDRLYMWEKTLEMVKDAPVLGVGLGNWEYAFPIYDNGFLVRPTHAPHRPHNDLLWIWSELGTLGLLAYLAVLLTGLCICVRVWKGPADWAEKTIAFFSCVALLAVVGAGMFSFPWERIPPGMVFWFALAVLGRLDPATRSISVSIGAKKAAIFLGVFLLSLGIWITGRHILFDYHYVKLTVAFQKDDHEKVLEIAPKVERYGPFDHQLYLMYGDGLLETGDFEGAERYFRTCLKYHPNFPNAYSNLALSFDRRDRHEEALAFYRRALQISPSHYLARFNMGTIFQKIGQRDSAIVAYRQSFRQHHTTPLVNLGVIYQEMGLPDSAIVVSQRALMSSSPPPAAWINVGRALVDKRDYGRAIEAYENYLKVSGAKMEELIRGLAGELAGAYSGLGIQAENRGEIDRAIEAHREALELAPDNGLNWYNLGNAYRKQGAWEKAIRAYRESLDRDSTSGNTYNNLGLTYNDMGRPRKAIETFERGLQGNPDEPIIHYNMGNSLAALDRKTQALDAFARFRAAWKGDAHIASYYMGKAYLDLNDPDRASAEFRAFLDGWTGDPGMADEVRRLISELKSR